MLREVQARIRMSFQDSAETQCQINGGKHISAYERGNISRTRMFDYKIYYKNLGKQKKDLLKLGNIITDNKEPRKKYTYIGRYA